jgi:hypothetical protein
LKATISTVGQLGQHVEHLKKVLPYSGIQIIYFESEINLETEITREVDRIQNSSEFCQIMGGM